MPAHIPLHTSLAANQSRKCKVNGCPRPRHKLCSTCRKHNQRAHRWGHPVVGRAWHAQDINTYHDVAEAFIDAHHDHVGIVQALAWIQSKLDNAVWKAGQGAAFGAEVRTLKHLATREVRPTEILTRILATTFFMLELPHVEADIDVYRANLGHHVLRAAPGLFRGDTQRAHARALGRLLFAGLRALLVNVIAHKRDVERAETAHEEALKTPFN
jgi:hypothetical protein